MPNVKGTAYRESRRWVDEILGDGAFARELAAAGFAAPAVFLESSWYPALPMQRALGRAAAKRGISVEDAFAEVARRNALADLKTVYRIFMRIAAPVRVLSHGARMWATYVDFGRAVVLRNDPGDFLGVVEDAPPELGDLVCGALRGFLTTAVEMAGGKSVATRIVSRDPKRVEFTVKYLG